MAAPPSPRYARHLAEGLAAYSTRTGREVAPHLLDVGRPAVRALYDQFRARPFAVPLGATEAEWVQLELGLKQVLRERLDRPRVVALRRRCAQEGWTLRVRELPPPGDGTALDGVDTSLMRDVHAYVGRDAAAVEEAAALDDAMIPHQADPVDGQFATDADSRRLGALLGYPPCCTAAFVRWHDHLSDNWQPIASAAAASRAYHPLLNNLALGAFHLIAWFPCRYDCPASLELARRVARELWRRHPLAMDPALAMLACPRVYLDERRQLVLRGVPEGGTVRYRSVHSPFSLDRSARTAPYEWVFYADVCARVAAGDRIWPDGEELVVARGPREIDRIHAPDAIWLPFGP
jgi:hypothetical protein